MLCITTSKWVLRTPFAGQMNFFALLRVFFNLFLSFFHHKCKIRKKNTQKAYKKVKQRLDATLKHWLTPKSWSTPGENFFFLNSTLNLTNLI